MINKIVGRLVEKKEQAVIIDVHDIYYEVITPTSVLQRIDKELDAQGRVSLITYQYFQLSQSSGVPVLIGFLNEVEREFFLQFIKVSGIGPRAAVKALDRPISEIAHAINEADSDYLKTLPGIGMQRAKEIIAKLQGKVGKFCLIQDVQEKTQPKAQVPGWQDEALEVLLQLQYKRPEALAMIQKALKGDSGISTTEDLLNEIYKQRVKV